MEPLTETLLERVERLVQAGKEPLLATTPTSLAVRELAARTEALERAVRELARDVARLRATTPSPFGGGV